MAAGGCLVSAPAFAYGIVVLPPPDVQRQLLEARKRHLLLQGVRPPHITVKSPFVMRHTAARVIDQLEAICEGFAPFEVTLGRIGQFGSSILYLSVLEEGPLRTLNAQLVEGLSGFVETLNQRWDGVGYNPHLTLAERLEPEDLSPLRRTLTGLKLRRRFLVERLYLFGGKERADMTRSFELLGEPAD